MRSEYLSPLLTRSNLLVSPFAQSCSILSRHRRFPAKISSEVTMADVMKSFELKKPDSTRPHAEPFRTPGKTSFIWPKENRPDIAHDYYDFELPVIDLSPVVKLESLRREIEQLDGDARSRSGLEAEIKACEAAKSDVLKGIREAFEEHGFFQIINCGFSLEAVEQLKESIGEIFDLPLEEKMKVLNEITPGAPTFPGYLPMKRDPPYSRKIFSYLWSEGFDIESPETNYPGRLDEIVNTLWPGGPETNSKGPLLRTSAEEYGKQSSRVVFLLMDLIVSSLGIQEPEKIVNEWLGDRNNRQVIGKFRVNNFPICDFPEMTWGLPCHTDPDVFTIVYQDAVGGLQLRFRDGTWHGVRPRAGAFIVNCGDFLQAWTNGRFLSAEHRVVANEKSRRMSIAAFVPGEMNYVVRPRPECVDAEHPVRYKPFTSVDYKRAFLSLGVNKERGELLERAFGIPT